LLIIPLNVMKLVGFMSRVAYNPHRDYISNKSLLTRYLRTVLVIECY